MEPILLGLEEDAPTGSVQLVTLHEDGDDVDWYVLELTSEGKLSRYEAVPPDVMTVDGLGRPLIYGVGRILPGVRSVPPCYEGLRFKEHLLGQPFALKLVSIPEYGVVLWVTDPAGIPYVSGCILGIDYARVVHLRADLPRTFGFQLDAERRIQVV